MSSNAFQRRMARFAVGDHVVVVHGSYWGKEGRVVEVIESRSSDFVFRYQVGFPDGKSAIFFALQLKKKESDRPA